MRLTRRSMLRTGALAAASHKLPLQPVIPPFPIAHSTKYPKLVLSPTRKPGDFDERGVDPSSFARTPLLHALHWL